MGQRLVDEGYNVNMIITIDPVGGVIPGYDYGDGDIYPADNLMGGVTTWYNVYGDPDSYDRSDFIAGVGGPWNDVDDATISLPSNNNHHDFSNMFDQSGAADFYRNNFNNGCGC